MLGLVLLLLAGLVLAILLVAAALWLTLTCPPRRTYASAVARGVPGEPSELTPARSFSTWTFTPPSVNGALRRPIEVWDLPGDAPNGPMVVLTHGWGDSRIGGLFRVPALAPVASRLLLWDLPGHGITRGRSALGAREARDLLALLECLGAPAILHGWSLGAGISMEAAVLVPDLVRGVIAETPYRLARTPAEGVLRARRLPAGLPLSLALGALGLRAGAGWRWGRGVTGTFDRRDVASRLACPLLILGAERDTVSPPADAEAIAHAGRGTLVMVPGATHNGLWRDETTRRLSEAALHEWFRRLA